MFFMQNFAVNPEEAQKGPNCLEFPWARADIFSASKRQGIPCAMKKVELPEIIAFVDGNPEIRQSPSPVEGPVVGKPIYLRRVFLDTSQGGWPWDF